MFKYSQKLIDEAIKVFKEEDSLDISVETAIEYLDTLGGLFEAFADRRTSAIAEVPCVPFPLKVEPVFPKPEAGPRVFNNKDKSYSLYRLDNST